MTRRIKRSDAYELQLTIKSESFIRPPRDSQRNWLLNQLMGEFAADLGAADGAARAFVPGADTIASGDRTQAVLADDEIMEDWQIPLMAAMAARVCTPGASVLEVGFGRGVASSLIQKHEVGQHTIIECNDAIVERFHAWRNDRPDRDVRLEHGLWQDRLPSLGTFDAILFHTYPLNEDEFVEQIAQSVTFAEHFFPHAAAHLVQGGAFTYLSFERDSMSRAHQRALFEHFSRIELERFPVDVPPDTRDAWWADEMLLVSAIR